MLSSLRLFSNMRSAKSFDLGLYGLYGVSVTIGVEIRLVGKMGVVTSLVCVVFIIAKVSSICGLTEVGMLAGFNFNKYLLKPNENMSKV